MSRLRLLVLACALFCWHGMALAAAPKAWGYVAWWAPDSWRSLPLAEFDRLLFFEMPVDAKGEITDRNGWPDQWSDLRGATQLSGTPLDLTLRCFDAAAFNTLFASPDATRRLLDLALELAGDSAVGGLQLDFEIYSDAKPEAIEAYRSFVRELSARLRKLQPARALSVFFSMGADLPMYDKPTLAQTDHVVFQGYDAHWLESKTAGPVAPLGGPDAITWEKVLAQGLELGVPRERMLLSFPLFGYEWPVKSRKPRAQTSGKGVHTFFAAMPASEESEAKVSVQERVRQYGATHDPVSGSSYYQFKRKDGRLIEGWFEDWWTLGRKLQFLTAEKLGGVAFFPLGNDEGDLVSYFLRKRGPWTRTAFVPAPATSPAGKTAEKSAEKPTEKPADKAIDKPAEKPPEKIADKPAAQ